MGRGVGVMSNTIICSVKQAMELMAHMDENDVVVLTVNNTMSLKHDTPKRIKKKSGEVLIQQATIIHYQNNDFFGRLQLYGVLKDESIIHNILFPQLE